MHPIPALLATAALAATLPVGAASLSFQQGLNGYSGTQDTTLMSSDAGTVHGADDAASIDASDGGSPNHVLLRFDGLFGNAPGQIRSTDTIVSATVTFHIDSQGSGVQFHDMLMPWDQATATWDSVGNGIQTNGIEAAVAPLLSLGANNGDANISGESFVADVTGSLRAMQSGSVPGYGWALMPFMPNGTNGLDFFTSEAFVANLRPLLVVEVSAVPEPGTYALLLAGLAAVGGLAKRRGGRG